MEFKIKKTLLIITSVLFITSAVFPQSKININNLVQYGDKWFKENDDKPFTGIVFDMSKATGNKILEAKYVQGFPHGKHAEWNNDGKKKVDGNYKSGVMNGKWTYYTKVGNCKYEINYKAGIYTVAVFTDNLGIKYTGQPITDRTEQDGIYLRQEENEYDFSKFPEFFGTLNDGKKDGLWTYWRSNGMKEKEISYKDGIKDGLWTSWYSNGQKEWERTYKDGELDGLVTQWMANGQKKLEGTFKDGERDVLYTFWYDNGQKQFEGIYKEGERNGLSTNWYENGQKKEEENYNDGVGDGLWTTWYENGQKESEGTFKDGVLVGNYTIYEKDGSIKEPINYETTLIERDYVYYTKDTNQPYSGQVFSLYENGQKKEEGTYKDGRKNGIWTYWYENGEKIFEGTYINGKENGLWHWWYNNGKKRLQGSFSNGEKTGEWLFFSTNDEPMSYNQEFSTKIYSSDGRMLDKLFNESKDLNPINSRNDEKNNHNIQGFVEYVRNSLRNKDLNIYRYGYNIHTSLDFRLQQIANESMMESVIINQKKMVSENNDSKNISLIQCAFIALDPITGSILAMIGGRSDYQDKLNRAVQSKRQPGSVFNLFVYTTALDNGYPVTTQLLNQPVVLNVRNADGELVKWMPKNYDGSTGGLTTFREGIRKSLNLIPVRMVQQDIAPAEQVKQMAKRLGINTDIWVGDAIALGTSEVYPLEIVSAYSALANKGVYSKPFAITKIEDRYGNVIKEYFPNRKEVMNEETAYLMTSLMQTVMDRGTGGSARWKYNFKRPAAGKTGTTQLWTDAWFIGFTPQIAAGCWFGIDDFRDSLGPGQDGSKVALPAWARFMKVAHDTLDLEIKKFEKPAGIIDKEICSVTKKVPLSACPVEVEIFKSRTEPTQKCKVHR